MGEQFVPLFNLHKITYTIFGYLIYLSYIYVYEKGRENNSNTRGD